MALFKVHLKHDAVTQQARSPRYAVDNRNWMLKHVNVLEDMGFLYRKKSSRWSSPVMIVPKPKHTGEFRMFIDCIFSNSQVQPMAGFLPILEVSMSYLKGASRFGSLDAFKGFRQFTLCQAICFFLTEYEVFTPTKLIQRSTDSAHAFQAGMMEVFEGMVYVSVLIWIDDVLLFAKTFEDYLQVLNRNETDLRSRGITRCERKISEARILFDYSRTQALLQLPEPTKTDEPEQFLCAASWIRTTIPRYAEAVSLPQELLSCRIM